MVRAALCVSLLLLGGCLVITRDQNLPPANLPLVGEIRQEALRESPSGDIVIVNARFADRIEDFGIDVRRTQLGPMPPSDADMDLLLRLFALALEEAPGGDRVGSGFAVREMREAAVAMRGAGPPGAPPVRAAFVRGLRVGVETLIAFSYGPLGEADDVTERASELEASYEAAFAEPPPMTYEAALEVLRRSVLTLKAILEVESTPGRQGAFRASP